MDEGGSEYLASPRPVQSCGGQLWKRGVQLPLAWLLMDLPSLQNPTMEVGGTHSMAWQDLERTVLEKGREAIHGR